MNEMKSSNTPSSKGLNTTSKHTKHPGERVTCSGNPRLKYLDCGNLYLNLRSEPDTFLTVSF